MPKNVSKATPAKATIAAANARKQAEFRRRMQIAPTTSPTTLGDLDEVKDGTMTVAPLANKAGTTTRPRTPAARPTLSYGSTIGRNRANNPTLSVEDEMNFVRKDITRLITLAAVAFAILIVLAFVL